MARQSIRQIFQVRRVDDVLEDDRVEVHRPLVSVGCELIAAHGACRFLA
jgi:hypothetical protein